ncbi:hypothetical protein FB107DRAFT_288756 [Schizophyllum commune]
MHRLSSALAGAGASAPLSSSLILQSDVPPPTSIPQLVKHPTPSFETIPSVEQPCPGLLFLWKVGAVEENFPHHLLSPKAKKPLGFVLLSTSPPLARSTRCLRFAAIVPGGSILPCEKCRDVQVEIDVLEDRARKPHHRVLQKRHLTYAQQAAKILQLEKQLNEKKLSELKNLRDLKAARARAERYKRVVQYAGEHTVPGMHRIFATALKERWGATKLLDRLDDATRGSYHPCNYSDTDIHLGTLIYVLGGAAAVRACNRSYLALPSLNTIQKYRRTFDITQTTDRVRLLELVDNINVVHAPNPASASTAPPTLCGHTAAYDEINIANKVEYVPRKDHIGNLCLEHLKVLDTIRVGDNTRSIEAAVDAVREGKVHVASEATVGSVSHLSRTGYAARPILIAPTCKRRTWQGTVTDTLYLLEAWHRAEYGERRYGPIFNLASDGDAIRRAAYFVICMSEEVKEGHPLWPKLHELFPLGLNPRACTVLCSPQGMLVDDEVVNKNIILLFLERIPDRRWPETSIISLLEPDDAQDVPRAIKLLLLISDIRKFVRKEDLDPSQYGQYRALCILGEMFEALLLPFIKPDLLLPEQTTSLIKFSHILYTLYTKNGRHFCSNQLYSDFQSMVKAAIFYTEKSRLLGSHAEVYFCLLGDDVIEALFGIARMIGGHSPNATVSELKYRFQAAMNATAIYEMHPEWELTPRRLKLSDTRDLDHLRPRHWKPEAVSVASCDVVSCWKAGAKEAEAALAMYSVKMAKSFAQLFALPGVDLMRPFGRYLAISKDVDHSMAEATSVASIEPESADALSEDITDNDHGNLLNIDFDAILAAELAEREAAAESGPHSLFARVKEDSDVVVHKQSIVNVYFASYDNRKSVDRALRLRLGDLFATVVSYDGVNLALVVAKTSIIKRTSATSLRSEDLTRAPISEVCLGMSSYVVSGQVLSMRPLDSAGTAWAWDGGIVHFASGRQPAIHAETGLAAPPQSRDILFSVPGGLLKPLSYCQKRVDDTIKASLGPAFDHERTWVVDNTQLQASWACLSQALSKVPGLQQRIPVFKKALGLFPYAVGPSAAYIHGWSWSISAEVAGITLKSDKRTCMICGRTAIKEGDIQMHVGAHLLKARAKVRAPYPCGFCGKAGCSVAIKGGGEGSADSSCSQTYNFRILNAKDFSQNRPCTNVPMRCPLSCGELHWKYNFQQHFEERHPSWQTLTTPAFQARIRISLEEQIALGVPRQYSRVWPPFAAPKSLQDKENVAPSLSSLTTFYS